MKWGASVGRFALMCGVALAWGISGCKPASQPPQVIEKHNEAAKQADAVAPHVGKVDDSTERDRAKKRVLEAKESATKNARDLCDALRHKDKEVRLEALAALEKVRPDLHKYLSPLLFDTRDAVQVNAATQITILGKGADPAHGILVGKVYESSLKIEDEKTKGFTELDAAIYHTLSKLKPCHPDDIEALKKVAAPETFSPIHRDQALWILGIWAEGDSVRQMQLLPFIKNGLEDKATRTNALNLAGECGKLSSDLVPAIRSLRNADGGLWNQNIDQALKKIEEASKK